MKPKKIKIPGITMDIERLDEIMRNNTLRRLVLAAMAEGHKRPKTIG